MNSPRVHPFRSGTAVALTLGLALAGCSSEDADPLAVADADVFCDAYVAVDATVFEAFGGPPDAPKDVAPFAAAVSAFAEVVPEGLQEAAATVSDPSSSEEEQGMALGQIDSVVAQTCAGDELIEVDAVDYGYEGLPSELPAGRTAISLTNGSTEGELHELLLLRRNDDVDASFQDLLAGDPAQMLASVTEHGFGFVAVPGAPTITLTDLPAGEYLAVCFLPQNSGTTGDGPPHVALGMQQEITVS